MVRLNKLKPKNPIMFVLVAIFLLVNIVDAITTFFILPGESNPLYLLFGSIWIIFAFKALILGGIIFYYSRNKYPSEFMYYLIVLILMLGISLMGLAVYGNIQGMLNPQIVEFSSKLTTQQKVESYHRFTMIFYFIPLAFCVLTFILFDKSKKHIDIDPEYFKIKRVLKKLKN